MIENKLFATQLVRAAESGLGRLGCPKVNLQVRVENADAVVAFYRRLGYAVEHRVSMGRRLLVEPSPSPTAT